MTKKYSVEELAEFENEIATLYREGKIHAPVHLRKGNEARLISIFEQVRSEDWVFGYWATHLQCLLKGVPREQLREAILEGRSIALCFPEFRIVGSGIVGSLAGVAVGTAWDIKRRRGTEKVWLFTGDMGAECGIFHESLKYATDHDLPIVFVVEDNGVSVMTDTRAAWGSAEPWFRGTRFEEKIVYFKYHNGWPHSGIGQRIAF